MNIGSNIKRLRRGRDMTQEQLAEYLNVSFSAVSQWERGNTMPDITMIPSLCALFRVTSDELLGIDNANREAEIDDMLKEAYDLFDEQRNGEALGMMRDMLKRYPDSYRLMDEMASCLCNLAGNGGIDREEGYAEAVGLIEKILSDCSDTPIRNSAIMTACINYPKVGRTDEAIALANSMSGAKSGLELLSYVYKGQKKIDTIRDRVWWMYNDFQNVLSFLAYEKDENDSFILSEDDRLTLFKKRLSLSEAVFEDGDYLFFSHWSETGCEEIAEIYARRRDAENTVKYAQMGVKYAKIHDTYEPDAKYTSVLLRGITVGDEYTYGSTDCRRMLEWYRNEPCFDFIREDERFAAVLRDLVETADTVKVAVASATRDKT